MMTRELNGDTRLSPADRLRYLWRNTLRWLGDVGRGPATTPFAPNWAACAPLFVGQSPSRLITEAFIQTLPTRLSPRDIEVLELGCGSGSMVLRLARLGYSGRYVGVDIDNRFAKTLPEAVPFERTFVQTDAHSYMPPRPIDLVFSLSALEHIPNDDDLVKRIGTFVARGGIQLHIVPAGAALPLYLWHGWRQFTPRMLRDRFGEEGTEIYRIGGVGSFLVHLVTLTPEIFIGNVIRRRATRLYRGLVRVGLRVDRALPFLPAAYVVLKRI